MAICRCPARTANISIEALPTPLGDVGECSCIHREHSSTHGNAPCSPKDMEGLAVAASVTALIQLASSTLRVTARIIARFHDAPEEIHFLSRQCILLCSELNFINELKADATGDDLALLPNETQDLWVALHTAEEVILEVQKACSKHEGSSKVHARCAWVFHDQTKMKVIISRLQEVRMSLQTILLLVNVRIASLSRQAIATASKLAITSNVSLLQDVAAIRKSVQDIAQQGRPQNNIVLNSLATREPHNGIAFWDSMAFLEKSWLHFLGIEAVLSSYGNDYQTTYSFSARQNFLGLKLLCLDLRVRRFPLAGLGLQFIAGGLSVRNVVSADSRIIEACRAGNVKLVRWLLKHREASTNDVTPENSGPLRYAIESGSKELVRELLVSGADVNSVFGQHMTSPLEWAFASREINIARLFIEKGATVDHVSAKGWTPVFNLFRYEWMHGSKGSCIEFLELLSAASFTDFNIQDKSGWSVMHRAAAYGTAEEVTALIKLGCSVTLLTLLNWMPIRCSVRFENLETFNELAQHMQPPFIDQQDTKGWTLLHEAAYMGSETMLIAVLAHGADPHMLSFSTDFAVPKGLENRILTPGDVAKHKGEETYKIYADALRTMGHDVAIVSKLEDDEHDIFWPAENEGSPACLWPVAF